MLCQFSWGNAEAPEAFHYVTNVDKWISKLSTVQHPHHLKHDPHSYSALIYTCYIAEIYHINI